MKKVRIYELAKELNVKSPRMLEILAGLGVPAKSAVGTIEEDTAALVKEVIEKEKRSPAPKAAKPSAKAAAANPDRLGSVSADAGIAPAKRAASRPSTQANTILPKRHNHHDVLQNIGAERRYGGECVPKDSCATCNDRQT